jgi:FKBP12-rapamycin complex-associated protein
LQDFWSPTSPIQNTIILLIEKIVLAMGEELKVYIPPLIEPVLRLFIQDASEHKLATQKVKFVNVQVFNASMLKIYFAFQV